MAKDLDILCVGSMVCDFMVKPVPNDFMKNELSLIDTIETNVGGDAANEAVTMSKLGMKVGIATEVGDDSTGTELRSYMEKNGVDTANMVTRKNRKTRTNVVNIREDGERFFLVFPLSFDQFGQDDLDYDMLHHIKMVCIGSIHIYAGLDKALPKYLKSAKEAGVITAADMVSNQTNQSKEEMMEYFQYLDYLIPSEGEATETTGLTDPHEIVEALRKMGAKNVILKLGAKGCLVKTPEEEFFVESFPSHPVDTTGAGDNFTGAFLSAVMKGWDIHKCATFACAVGSIAIESMGASTGLKNEEQVYERMRQSHRL